MEDITIQLPVGEEVALAIVDSVIMGQLEELESAGLQVPEEFLRGRLRAPIEMPSQLRRIIEAMPVIRSILLDDEEEDLQTLLGRQLATIPPRANGCLGKRAAG